LKHVYLDASALVKRFRLEIGSDIVNDTVDRVLTHDPRRVFVSALTTVETLSILNRRRNDVQIPLPEFVRSLRGVIHEIKRFSHYLVLDDHFILASAIYTIKHNINSADAIHLAITLSLREASLRSGADLVCMTADKRLVRASQAEGITVVDPEQSSLEQARAAIV
jgi:predicted nucleic acid-binding protein